MMIFTRTLKRKCTLFFALILFIFTFQQTNAQTLAFPGAQGFGRFAKGARGAATQEVYVVTNLNDAGAGSFRDAVSKPGRIVVFAVGGIVYLSTDIVVAPNVTIAGQTAPGEGIVFFGKRVTFSSASNTIARYLRIRLGATGNSGKDASGLSNGANMIFDHMSFTWGMDEVFSINWDGKGTAPDSITVQNSIIGQGLHRENHSAGGLIQTPDGGKVSLIRNLYISNKTRNPKVKGVNEFVNNVVYNWGNGNRLGDNLNYGWSGEGYIMGGSSGVSEVNIINNYFMSGPLTPPDEATPFSRGTGSFYLYGAGNYFDNNKDGMLNGELVPYNTSGYPGIAADGFKTQPFLYPAASPSLTAEQAYQWIIDSVGASYPRRDQVDGLLVDEVRSKGTQGYYVYRESDLPFTNGGVGEVFSAPTPMDSDNDGMPDAWEDAYGLNKNDKQDAVAYSSTYPEYLNIEVYVNSLISTPPPVFVKPPSAVTLSASTVELPSPSSTIVINWKDNSDNESYFILERSEDGVGYTDIAHPEVNATTYTDNNRLPNTTYYYRLKAVAGSDASAYSAAVSVKTPPLPTAPTATTTPSPANGYQYAEPMNGKLVLKWTGSSNTTTYALYFGSDPASLSKLAEVAYVADPTYEVSGLADFTTYYWRVDAINDKGTTEGPVWSFRTTKVIPPALVGSWSFDETDGRQVTDSSEFQNHGILGLDDDDQSIRVTGKVNNALDFATADPSMYVVSIPHEDQLHLDKGSFSISFWMKANASLLPPDNNTSAYLLCKGSITRNAATGATGKRFDIEFKNKQFRFAIDDDNDANGGGKDELQADGTPFFTGEWVHAVAIRDTAAKKLRLYLNGALVKETSITKAKSGIGEASALVIGNIGELEFLSTTNKPAPYKGMLDELKIYNYVLTPTQILEQFHTSPLPIQPFQPSITKNALLEGYDNQLPLSWKGGIKTSAYKLYIGTDADNLSFVADVPVENPSYLLEGLTPKTTYYWRVDAIGEAGITTGATWSFRTVSPKGLVGHWQLDETGGTMATDNSVYQQHGTVTSMPGAVWTEGKYGNSLQFVDPASTGAVNIPHAEHLMFDQNPFTISLWVKLTNGNSNYNSASPAKDCYLIHKGQFTDPGGKWYGIQLRDSVLTFAIDDASSKSSLSVSIKKSSPYFMFNNNWSHIAAVKDVAAKQIRLYINGVLASSVAYSSNGTIGKALPLLLGNSAENKPFHDVMDDVRLYNYGLTLDEIKALYNGSPLVQKTTGPTPSDGSDDVQPEKVDFKWSGNGQTYNFYLGTSPGSMELKGSGNWKPEYSISDLLPGKQYYWRTDAVRDGDTVTGDIWSFTTEADKVPPVVITKDVTITLSGGHAQITPADVDNGSNDRYGIASITLSKEAFDCSNIGVNEVTVTVTDNYGNVSSATANVTVIGAIPQPAITVSRTDKTPTGSDDNTIYLGYGAQELILTAFDQGSTAVAYNWSPGTYLSSTFVANPVFKPVQAGQYNIEAAVTNEYGCTANASVLITVQDVRCGNNGDKVIICHNGDEICIEKESVQMHLTHGCRIGICTGSGEFKGQIVAKEQPYTKEQLTIIPNPVTNTAIISFNLDKPSRYKVEIYSITGVQLSILKSGVSSGQTSLAFNVASYKSGVYLVKLTTDTEVITKQIVVQR